MAAKTIEFFKGIVDKFPEEIANFGTAPTMYAGLVDDDGGLQWYDGRLKYKDAEGATLAADIQAKDYATYIGEAGLKDSYLKAPYYKPIGYPQGVYRVGPLARLNVADMTGTPEADKELAEFRQRFGPMVHSSFHYHYARLVELTHALEKMERLAGGPGDSGNARAVARGGELPGRRGHDRGAARRADPPLQGGREGRHPLGQPDRGDGAQQPGDQSQRGRGGAPLRQRATRSRKAC